MPLAARLSLTVTLLLTPSGRRISIWKFLYAPMVGTVAGARSVLAVVSAGTVAEAVAVVSWSLTGWPAFGSAPLRRPVSPPAAPVRPVLLSAVLWPGSEFQLAWMG